jgi:hypothetical protein
MIYNDQKDFLEEKVYVNSDTTDTAKYQHNASLPGRLCVILSAQCKYKFCNRTGYRVLFDNGNLVCVSEGDITTKNTQVFIFSFLIPL